jgi:o-succinylbenzoate synthase
MTALTLENVELHELELELVRPLSTSNGTVSVRRVVVFEGTFVVDGKRVVGFGESAPMPGWGTETFDASLGALEAVESGGACELDDVSGLSPSLDGAPTARFAVELAALDAVSKARGVALATFLADDEPAAAEVLLNATIGASDAEDAARQAVEAVEDGFSCLKMKVGVRELTAELAVVSRVRDVVGDTISIRLDANGAWSEQEALGALKSFAPRSIEYVEQPVPADQLEALGRLNDASPIAIAADESVATPARAGRLIDEALVDVLVVKPMAMGGVLAALDIADRAHAAGIGVTFTSFIDSAIGRTAVAHAAASRRWLRGAHGIATGAWLATDVISSPDPIVDGAFQLENVPGLGREFVL